MPAPRSLLTRTCHPCLCRRGVIGGGIIGASASYYPARRVVKVALLEKGRIGAGPSSRNWGGPILDPAPYAPARLNQSARGKVADF